MAGVLAMVTVTVHADASEIDPVSFFESIDRGPTHDRMIAKGWCSRAAAHPELNRYCGTVCLVLASSVMT